MSKQNFISILATIIVTSSLYAAPPGFGIDIGTGVSETHRQIKDTDYQIQNAPDVLLKDYYGTADKYVNLKLTTNTLSNSSAQLEIGTAFHFRKNSDYEIDFDPRVVFSNVLGNFDLKVGGIIGMGKIKSSAEYVTTDNFLKNGTATTALPDSATFVKYGLTTGVSYPIYQNFEIFINVDWFDKKYNFHKELNGGDGDSKASQMALENYKIESLATSFGVSYTF